MAAEPSAHPYETHLDILHGPLEVVDVQAVVDAVRHPWYNQTLCKVNDSVVRLGVVQGEYHWHEHHDLDEFFYVAAAGIRGAEGGAPQDARAGARGDPHGGRRGDRSHRGLS
jgi:hypothetical protein